MSLDKFIFSYGKFPKILDIEEINEKANELSANNRELLLSIVDSVVNTLYIKQQNSSFPDD